MQLNILLYEHPRLVSPYHFNDVANAPLSSSLISAYIAAFLQQRGFCARIYDSYLYCESFEESAKNLKAMSFDILGVHSVYFWEHTHRVFQIIEELKSEKPHITVILYGFFPTFAYRQIFEKCPSIDCIIIGEPEITFLEIATNYKKDKKQPYRGIKGIAFVEDGQVKRHANRELISFLDEMPFPERTSIYLEKIGGNLLGSRGCYANCIFCYINNFYGCGPRWRGRSPENIALEIEQLVPRLNKQYIYFTDANFFAKGPQGKARALAIADKMSNWRGLHFGIECRCNDIDKKILPLLIKSGLKDVFLGIESGSSNTLKRLGKGLSKEKSEDAVKLLHSYGIAPNLGFIMFDPDSTLEDIRDNFEFLRKNGLLHTLYNSADVLYHREIVFRGTRRFRMLSKQKRIKKTDPFGYEASYRFSDDSVSFFADLMENVCKEILKEADQSSSPIFWQKEENTKAKSINEFLVLFFDEVLSRLQLREIPPREDERQKLESCAIDTINKLLGKEQKCMA